VNQLSHEFEEELINLVNRLFVKKPGNELKGEDVLRLLRNHGYRDSFKIADIKRIIKKELGTTVRRENRRIIYSDIDLAETQKSSYFFENCGEK
jgi:hypothetical protein